MPRMVGEKSSIVPVAIGGIIIAAIAVAVWYATRGSQTTVINDGNAPVPGTRLMPSSRPGAVGDNAVSESEVGNSAVNQPVGAMGADNSVGAMDGNAMGADNAMGAAGNTNPMGSAGANSAGVMNGADNAATPMTGATPMGGIRPMPGGNAMPVPPPVTNR